MNKDERVQGAANLNTRKSTFGIPRKELVTPPFGSAHQQLRGVACFALCKLTKVIAPQEYPKALKTGVTGKKAASAASKVLRSSSAS